MIPLKMKDLLDDIVLVCAALTNLMPPLIQNRGQLSLLAIFKLCRKLGCV